MQRKPTPLNKRKEIINAKLSNPDLSLRDIAKQTGVSKDAVDSIIKKIPDIQTIKDNANVDMLNEIVEGIKEITYRHIKKVYKDTDMSPKDISLLNNIAEVNRKRKQILEGKPTDIKDFKLISGKYTPKELEELRQQLL